MGFALEDTNVYREVQAIFSDGAKPVTYFWTGQVHTPKKTLTVFKVMSVEFHRNYLNNFFDEIYVDLMMGEGDYLYDVEPYRDKLEITLTRIPLTEVTGYTDYDAEPETQRYRAVMMVGKSEVIEGNTVHKQTQETANRGNIKQYSFQLLDRVVEQIRAVSSGGIFRNTTSTQVARTLLTTLSKEIKVDNELAIKGVDLAPKYSETVRKHIQIPQNTELCRIPQYLHEAYGIYAAGFWYYLQKGYWYMYPTYDLERYSQSNKTLTVVNIPSNRMPSLERTYRKTVAQTLIISTGKTNYTDKSEYDVLNEGNAVRFIEADNITSSFITVKDNKAQASLKRNLQECVVENRVDNNNIRRAPTRITSNVAFEKSRIAARLGSFIQTTWESARDDLVYPGMPVKYIYEVEGVVQELIGCVVGAVYVNQLNGQNLIATQHICRAVLTLFVSKVVKIDPEE